LTKKRKCPVCKSNVCIDAAGDDESEESEERDHRHHHLAITLSNENHESDNDPNDNDILEARKLALSSRSDI
jgi:hypothetical protein